MVAAICICVQVINQGDFPEKEYAFFNRGISGNTLRDLEKRWEEDVIGMKPDVLSVLVGTNDVHYYLQGDKKEPFDFEGWEKCYRSLLDRSLQVIDWNDSAGRSFCCQCRQYAQEWGFCRT